MSSLLDQLKTMTNIVGDTGDVDAIRRAKPEEATTNPSLLLKASTLPEYTSLIDEAIDLAKGQSNCKRQQVEDASDKIAVGIGMEILKVVPGRISTEVDARLSFDLEASLKKAPQADGAVQRSRHRQRPRAHQAGIHLGRHPGWFHPRTRRHPLQT